MNESDAQIRTIMTHWFGTPEGLKIPDDYTFLDIETTGFKKHEDLIVEVGWCIVRNRQVADCSGAVLNWYGHPAVSNNWLTDRLERVSGHMASRGATYWFTPERLMAEGGPPDEVLRQYVGILERAMASGEMIMGHAAWTYDKRMLNEAKHQYVDATEVAWRPGFMIDTGLIEKSAQIEGRLPKKDETLDAWLDRSRGPGVGKWSLFDHAIPKYRLVERYGLDLSQAHRAPFDCLCGHKLFETYRDIAEGRPI